MQSKEAIVFAKSPEDAQRAHDLLFSVLASMIKPDEEPDWESQKLIAYMNVLCWLLGHSDNPVFGREIELLEEMLAEMEIYLIREDDGEPKAQEARAN